MASRPSLYPYWATTTTNLTGTGNTNKVRPKTSLRDIGWDLGQQPTCEEFNWQLNNIDQWVEYLDSIVFAATASDTANTLALRDSNSSFAVKQLTSTAPNGTKPFNVTSTTKVDNLNVDLLDGFSTSQTATANTVAVRDSNGKLVSDLTGNASTSDAWKTARNLSFTGFANGNGNIDGSGNVSIALSYGSGFTNSKSVNGYAYRPDGLIEQWGYTNADTITLPITYPNACLNASISSNNTATAGYDYKIAVSNLTTSSITITKDTDDAGSYVYWRTIGF